MSIRKTNINREIVALFSGQSDFITTPKLYIRLTSSYSRAIVLSQCLFWCNKSKYDDGWFYKTYEEWFEEICIPERTLRRIFDELEVAELIFTKVKKVNGLNIKHAKPNVEKIIECISSMLEQNIPFYPEFHQWLNDDKTNCSKTTPAGQVDRSEPAKFSGSYTIDTEENLHNATTSNSKKFLQQEIKEKPFPDPKVILNEDSANGEHLRCTGSSTSAVPEHNIKKLNKETATTNNRNFFEDYKKEEEKLLGEAFALSEKEAKKEKFKKEALEDEKCKKEFTERFSGLDVTIEELYEDCCDYWEQSNQLVYKSRFLTHLQKCKVDKYSPIKTKQTNETPISKEQSALIDDYKEYVSKLRADIRIKLVPQDTIILNFDEWDLRRRSRELGRPIIPH